MTGVQDWRRSANCVDCRRFWHDGVLRQMNEAIRDIRLDDKYDLAQSRIYLTGTQALIRLMLMQHERDRLAGRNTAGFVSGYRGSPLGALDTQILKAKAQLDPANIVFRAGINEEVAATACWGTQQAEMRGEGRFDGVFSLWYGKGPGVDRSGDAMRHANMAGTSPFGGVLAVMGDDHTAESSTIAHQSEYAFVNLMMPIFSPAGVQEILDYGLYGFALSRYAGVWSSLKGIKDTIESSAVVDGALDRVSILRPDFQLPLGGLNIRPNDGFLAMEERLHRYKLPAMLAFIRANAINRVIVPRASQTRIGIITAGKSYLDTLQALSALGIAKKNLASYGVSLLKLGCTWPVDPEIVREFSRGLDLVFVVEEKRPLIESQVREALYGMIGAPVAIGKQIVEPMIIGKCDENGAPLLPSHGALDASMIAIALGERIIERSPDLVLSERIKDLRNVRDVQTAREHITVRTPHFCSGCPHNSSTVVPEGMRAYSGIGCHTLSLWMDRSTEGFTQMGGEGANWVGESPFSTRGHMIQNLGDGTYVHSGLLAIRFAIASKVNITYKILFNDAVAMTGGQALDGALTVERLVDQVFAEGAVRVALVSDEPTKYGNWVKRHPELSVSHRRKIEDVQRALAKVEGVTILIHDQTCALEKRRRRKRGDMKPVKQHVIINELVCEGCGDCGRKSNCVSIQPIETEYGRKRVIDQASCNIDLSCLEGFCPALVTVHGAELKKPVAELIHGEGWSDLAPPRAIPFDGVRSILLTGVGGTGVVTVAAVLGMAAHIDGKACGTIDMTGMAQKGGAVMSHVRIAKYEDDLNSIRIGSEEADVVLGGDLVVTGMHAATSTIRQGITGVLVNTHETMPGEFTRNADYRLPTEKIKQQLQNVSGAGSVVFINATELADRLVGHRLGANMILLGMAFQYGLIPLTTASIEKAIRLNGEAVDLNLAAFRWGRRIGQDRARVEAVVAPSITRSGETKISTTREERIARRIAYLTRYQNASYARRYSAMIETVQRAEDRVKPKAYALTDAVASGLFKLMTYKDEYEVARLYTDGSFRAQLQRQFEGKSFRLRYYLARPFQQNPLLKPTLPRKAMYGGSTVLFFHLLARLKFLRGTLFDIFGYTAERRMERRLVRGYSLRIENLIADLTPDNHAIAVRIASLPDMIRGFGHVKMKSIEEAGAIEARLLSEFNRDTPSRRSIPSAPAEPDVAASEPAAV